MAQYMNRTPGQPGQSNYDSPVGPYQFYEQRYVTVGPQEWIFAPDSGAMYVTIFFPTGGAAFIESTDEGPTDINSLGLPANAPSSLTGLPIHYGHNYPQTATVSDVVRVKIEGATAIRVNLVGGSCDITVRV